MSLCGNSALSSKGGPRRSSSAKVSRLLQTVEFEFYRLKETVETSSDRVSDSSRKQKEAAEAAQKEVAQIERTKPPLWSSNASAKTEVTKPPLRSGEPSVNEAAVDRPGSPSDDGLGSQGCPSEEERHTDENKRFYDEARDLLDGLDSPCDSRPRTPVRDEVRTLTGLSSFSAELKAYQDEP